MEFAEEGGKRTFKRLALETDRQGSVVSVDEGDLVFFENGSMTRHRAGTRRRAGLDSLWALPLKTTDRPEMHFVLCPSRQVIEVTDIFSALRSPHPRLSWAVGRAFEFFCSGVGWVLLEETRFGVLVPEITFPGLLVSASEGLCVDVACVADRCRDGVRLADEKLIFRHFGSRAG
jgi:hypothetical protein